MVSIRRSTVLLLGLHATSLLGAPQLEEVVVSAQKREQSLQDVPISVGVMSADALKNLDITNSQDLEIAVPGLQFGTSNTNRGEGFSVRGVGTFSYSDGVEQSVSLVVDEVVLGRAGASAGDMIDINRIEILRGPQGMLFGKNATAGLVHVIGNRPHFDGGEIQLRAGMTQRKDSFGGDETKWEIVGNQPITQTLAARFVVTKSERDAWVQNIGPTGQHLNGMEEKGAKLKLLWEPRDDVSFYLIADRSERDGICCAYTSRITPQGNYLREQSAPVVASATNETANQDGDNFLASDLKGGSIAVNWDIADYTLTSITAKRRFFTNDNAEADLIPIELLNHNYGGVDQEQTTQEFRLAYNGSDRYDYVLGLYYFNQKMEGFIEQVTSAAILSPGAETNTIAALIANVAPGGRGGRQMQNFTDTKSYSAFGQVNFNIMEGIRGLVGLRITEESLEYDYERKEADGATIGLPPPIEFDGTADTSEMAWRVGIQYDIIEDSMLYATVSRGFKGAGVDLLADSNSPDEVEIEPEIVDSIEFGIKAMLFEQRMMLNASIYYSDFTEFQAQTFDITALIPAFKATNAGRLTSRGMELDFQAQLADWWLVSGGFAYIRAVFEDFFPTTCYPGQPQSNDPEEGCTEDNVTAANGNDLQDSPRWTATITNNFQWPVSENLGMELNVNYYWRDEVYYTETEDPNTRHPSYGIFNLNLGLGAIDETWGVSLFAKNLFDEHFVAAILAAPLANDEPAAYAQFATHNSRRVVGLGFEYRFDW